jgi:O-antigen/teichoic acid export membrane protein
MTSTRTDPPPEPTAGSPLGVGGRGSMGASGSQSLGTRAARGVVWTAGAAALQLGSLLVLYRLLPIASMGRFEYALILVMLVALLANLGLNVALVQRREVDEADFDSSFWLSLGVGVGLCAAVLAAAPPLGALLGGDAPSEFERALRVQALILPCAAISGIFRARLQRQLRFGAIAGAELASVLTFGVYVVPLVFVRPQWGVWIPLTGSVLRELGLLVAMWHAARWSPRFRFSLTAVRALLPFGLNFTGSRVLAYLNTNIASLYIFPLLGDAAQGYYRLAERLTTTPLMRLSTTISNVSLPTFSTIQDDNQRLVRGYMSGVQSLVLLLGPLLALLYVYAPEVLTLVGQPAARNVLRLLAVATLLRAMGTMVGSVYVARGRADWLLRWSVFCLVVLVPALVVSVPRGIDAVAAVIAGSSLLFLVVSQHLVDRLTGLSARQCLAGIARPMAVVAAVAVAGAAARPWLSGPPAAVLLQGAAVGTAAAAASVRLCAWSLLVGYYDQLRGRRATAGKPGPIPG